MGSLNFFEGVVNRLWMYGNFFKEVLNRLQMHGNGYSMAIVLDHRSTALTETKIGEC